MTQHSIGKKIIGNGVNICAASLEEVDTRVKFPVRLNHFFIYTACV